MWPENSSLTQKQLPCSPPPFLCPSPPSLAQEIPALNLQFWTLEPGWLGLFLPVGLGGATCPGGNCEMRHGYVAPDRGEQSTDLPAQSGNPWEARLQKAVVPPGVSGAWTRSKESSCQVNHIPRHAPEAPKTTASCDGPDNSGSKASRSPPHGGGERTNRQYASSDNIV